MHAAAGVPLHAGRGRVAPAVQLHRGALVGISGSADLSQIFPRSFPDLSLCVGVCAFEALHAVVPALPSVPPLLYLQLQLSSTLDGRLLMTTLTGRHTRSARSAMP